MEAPGARQVKSCVRCDVRLSAGPTEDCAPAPVAELAAGGEAAIVGRAA